jgi:hypothetical protein
LSAALALSIVSSGCASNDSESKGKAASTVTLRDRTQLTGGKALHFTASTDAKLSADGGRFAIELRGIDLGPAERATYDAPDYRDADVCVGNPCEWTVVPEEAATYEFRAFLLNLDTRKSTAQSPPVRAVWKAPPRPHDLQILINGKNKPLEPLNGADKYLETPAGKLQVEARWTTPAQGTGYYVVVSTAEPEKRDHAKCSTGTSCVVPKKVALLADQEMSWHVKVLTAKGDKVATAFRVCLVGRA